MDCGVNQEAEKQDGTVLMSNGKHRHCPAEAQNDTVLTSNGSSMLKLIQDAEIQKQRWMQLLPTGAQHPAAVMHPASIL